MKRILLLSYAVLICFQFSNVQEKNPSKSSAPRVSTQDQKFVDMEKALWEASDKFFEVDVTGTYDKATEISYMDKCD